MFKTEDHKVFVGSYAVEIYLPYDYLTAGYRGTPCYTLIGDKIRFFGVGNYRIYKDKKEMENPFSVKTSPLIIPMMINSKPTDIDTREVQFVKDGVVRKCIVLTYYKDDMIVTDTICVQNLANMMILLGRLDGGKLDHLSPIEAVYAIQEAQRLNKINLRMPYEEIEMYVSERFRNPSNHKQKYRFATNPDDDKVVSYNMREEAMQTTTYQAITHEDINSSLITSINRKRNGVIDEPTPMEIITRGLDIAPLESE